MGRINGRYAVDDLSCSNESTVVNKSCDAFRSRCALFSCFANGRSLSTDTASSFASGAPRSYESSASHMKGFNVPFILFAKRRKSKGGH